jgi:hypothetical protein
MLLVAGYGFLQEKLGYTVPLLGGARGGLLKRHYGADAYWQSKLNPYLDKPSLLFEFCFIFRCIPSIIRQYQKIDEFVKEFIKQLIIDC